MMEKIKELDFVIVITIILLTILGIIFIYSASQGRTEVYKKQIIWATISFMAFFSLLLISIKTLIFYSPLLYFLSLLPLLFLLFFGKRIAGAKSWIDFGFFSVQPSEFVKITTSLFLAKIISGFKTGSLRIREIVTVSLVVFIPCSLIFLQPDYGTAFILLSLIFASILIGGIRTSTIIFLMILILIGGLFAWEYVLKDYHRARIVAIFFPEIDPQSSSYQLKQSKIALGSGGLSGKGFLKGTLAKGGFLPASTTDFILSSVGEEFGFIGIMIILTIYTILFLRCFRIAENVEERACSVFVFLISFLIFFQFVLNTSMILGFFPVIGIPLPFLSYGGSSLLSLYLCASLLLNAKIRGKIE